jgi:hypothetical protein
MKFASGLMGYLKSHVLPQGKAQMALEYAPDAIGALITAGMFGGGNPGRSAAIGVEDMGIGLLGSMGGRMAGDLLGRKVLKLTDPGQIQMAQLMGGMPAQMLTSVLAPRPILDGVMEKRMQEEQARQGLAPQPATTQPVPAQAAQPQQPQGLEIGQLPADLGLRSQGLASGMSAQDEIRKIMDDLLAGQPQEVRDAVNSAMGAR